MANKPIEMKKLRAVLRLHIKGRGKRSIAQACGISKTTVRKYIEVYNRLGIPWEELTKLNDKELHALFIQAAERPPNPKLDKLQRSFISRFTHGCAMQCFIALKTSMLRSGSCWRK